jgi:hypothetical protein
MKHKLSNSCLVALVLASSVVLSGCAALGPNVGANGVIYNNTTVPNYAAPTAGDASLGSHTGVATTHDVLGLVSWGDAGTEQAANNGGITQIKTIDVGTYNILGLYSERVTKVNGLGPGTVPHMTSSSSSSLDYTQDSDDPYFRFRNY